MTRWEARLGLSGEPGRPREYDGYSEDGGSSMRVSGGTVWIGIGPTPEAALAYAQEERAAALPEIEDCLAKLRTILAGAVVQRRSRQPVQVDEGLLLTVRSFFGAVPEDPSRWSEAMVRGWISHLEAPLPSDAADERGRADIGGGLGA